MTNLNSSELEILKSIQMLDSPTRHLISKNAGMSVQKVSQVLKTLESKRIIRKAGKAFSSSGRPSYIYEMDPKQMYTIGAAISNHGISLVVTDATKEIVKNSALEFSEEALVSHDPTKILEEIIDPLKKAKADIEKEGGTAVSIGISLPGMIDTARRVWLSGLQLPGINHLDINKEICKRMDIPVYVEDNSRIISYYEKVEGHGKDLNNFVVLYLGIGVGAGIIIDKSIYRGANGTAGEIGHIIHSKNNYRCSCGNVGCLETVTSDSGVIRVFKDRLSEGVHSLLQPYANTGTLTLEAILQAANEGDKLARTTLFEIGQFIGDACTILINLFNPEKLFITGTLEILKNHLMDAIMLSLDRKVVPSILENTKVEFTPYSAKNEAYGAALFAVSQYWNDLLTNEDNFMGQDCE
ncbi:ROK family protein [Pleomorphochaeta sp. DL1XJH-081]|uniref:ROK family protein n=1 Tax=Pleomorphochaeta sp. DL1XJH-081 TaxID=3409690 RepID=UPI003BB6377A